MLKIRNGGTFVYWIYQISKGLIKKDDGNSKNVFVII